MANQGDAPVATVLLMRVWSDTEAEMIRQILEANGIPVTCGSDVPHSLLPVTVDGLGEIRIVVPAERAEEARAILAEHRRSAIEIVKWEGGGDEPGAGS